MRALGAAGAARLWVALVAVALGSQPLLRVSATLNSVLVNSNAIKNVPPPLGGAAGHPGSAVSAAPGILYEGGNNYQALDNYQVSGVAGTQGRVTPKGSHSERRVQRCCARDSGARGSAPRGSGGWMCRGAQRSAAPSPAALGCGLLTSPPPFRSPTRARRTRSAAPTSTAPARPAQAAPACRSASPAGSAANAACATRCAAREITAKTVSPGLLSSSSPRLGQPSGEGASPVCESWGATCKEMGVQGSGFK